jgi:hypothetical protein
VADLSLRYTDIKVQALRPSAVFEEATQSWIGMSTTPSLLASRSVGKPAEIQICRSRYLWHEIPADPGINFG